ncbi:MAG: hydrogenase accessory protein [Phyllobacteriaceae bacterium]|nr:hydrogenase accessory protein [Phyllobacteriaceae bacterium]
MSHPLLTALAERYGLPTVDATSIDACLAPASGEAEHVLLFFTGDPATRAETLDVAVVMPEILAAFQRRLRGAVVDRAAEAGLASRFHVAVMPSLVVTRRDETVAVLPKIRDWSEYMEKIEAALAPDAPALVAEERPRVAFTTSRAADREERA